jgi:hypothetical protein
LAGGSTSTSLVCSDTKPSGSSLLIARVAVAGACLASVFVAAAAAADGGSGTYTSAGPTYDFNLFNGGSTAWQYFIVVGASGTRFVGGSTGNESSARCVVGQPDGQANEMECGPMSPGVIPPTGHLAFVATLNAFPDCGAPFQVYAGSTGTPPFSRVGDATFSGSCAAVPPRALATPSVHGVPRVGRTLTATAPTWNATPTRVAYQWQLCTATGCVPIESATRLTLRLTKRTAGRTVRIASVATFGGLQVESVSKRIAVRA